MWWVKVLTAFARVLVANLIPFLTVIFRSRTSLIAENLFFRKQLAFYQEHKPKAQLLTDAARWSLELWSRLFDWRSALVIVKPDTLIGWHRKGFQRFWRCKSRPGRPTLQGEICELIVRMAKENPSWGQRQVAAELYLKLSILVSPRTVRKYWPWGRDDGRGKGTPSQRWATFVRNHADAMVACDFMVAVTAKFQLLYVFVILELGPRRILQCNVTAHPTAEWTLQEFRKDSRTRPRMVSLSMIVIAFSRQISIRS